MVHNWKQSKIFSIIPVEKEEKNTNVKDVKVDKEYMDNYFKEKNAK